MSRAGYSDDWSDNWSLICWRGAVASAIRGKRGQKFLREALAALDAMEVKELIAGDLESSGQFCLLGAVGHARKLDMKGINTEDWPTLSKVFDISEALAREIMWENDDNDDYWNTTITPQQRFDRMRKWIVEHINPGETK